MAGFDDLSNMIKMANSAKSDENVPLDQQFRQIINKSNNNKEKISAIVNIDSFCFKFYVLIYPLS
jgi:hypothetical protein